MTTNEATAFHLKYRPKSLSEIIGHTTVVTALQGIIKSKKFPSALAFFGPPSAGKTTLSMCFAADTIGADRINGSDYTYVNVGDKRTIEDVREFLATARLSPMGGIRRFVHLDEVQNILSNAPAATSLLAPLEQPHPRMTWLLSSMSPEKFQGNKNGQAILSRCTQYHLKPYTSEDLTKQANRIIRGEEMTYMSKEIRDHVVRECQGEMRTLANLLEGLSNYWGGLPDKGKPDKLSAEDVQHVMQAIVADDEKTAVRLLTALYAKKIGVAQREILSILDGFAVINKMMYINYSVMNDAILKGARHPKVWMTVAAKALKSNLNELGVYNVGSLSRMQTALIDLRGTAQTFAVPEDMALFRFAASVILSEKE